MKSRAEIKEQARAALKAQYGSTLCITLVMELLLVSISGASFGVAGLILSGPLTVALSWGMLCIYRGLSTGLGDAFSRGFDNVGRKIGGYLWMLLWSVIWSFLFVIPGFVKAFSYALVPYILVDMPHISAKEALKLSMRMMQGHKWQLFVLELSFLGWAILSALTFGILAILYVEPYMELARAGFYDEAKQDAIRRGILVPAGMPEL